MAQFNDNEPLVGDNSFSPFDNNNEIPTMDDVLAETAPCDDDYEYGEYDDEELHDGSQKESGSDFDVAAAWKATSATDVAQGESDTDFDWEAAFQEEPATDIAQGELAQSVPQPELVEDAETFQNGDTDDLFDDLLDFDPHTDSNDIDTSTVYDENTQDQPMQHTLTLPPVAPQQSFVAPGGLTLPPGGTAMPQNNTSSSQMDFGPIQDPIDLELPMDLNQLDVDINSIDYWLDKSPGTLGRELESFMTEFDNTAANNFPMADMGADLNMANPLGDIAMTNNQFMVDDFSTLPSNNIPGSNTGGNFTMDPFLPAPNDMTTAGNYATGSYPPIANQYTGISSNGNYPGNDPPHNRFKPINPSNHASRQPPRPYTPVPEPSGLYIYTPGPLAAEPPRPARRQTTATRRPVTATSGDYEPFTVAPPSWGEDEASDTPLFEYRPHGEWKQGKVYTSQQILQFIIGPNKDGRAPSRDKMTIWIQTPPNCSNNRAPSTPVKCCWEDCPVPSRTIQKGQFRVAFDEHPDTSGITTDPFYNTGYMHLYCMEQCVPLIRFINHPPRHVQVAPDDRVFNHPRENGVNSMALGTPHCRDALDVYDRWVEATTEKDQAARERGRNSYLTKGESLYYALTEHHLTKTQSRKKGPSHIHLSDYMGDLRHWQYLLNERKSGKVPPSRVKRPRDEEEEEEDASPPERKTSARAAKRPRNYSEVSEADFIHVTTPPPQTPPPPAPKRARTGRGILTQPAPSSGRKRTRGGDDYDDEEDDDVIVTNSRRCHGRRESYKRVKVEPPSAQIDPRLLHIGPQGRMDVSRVYGNPSTLSRPTPRLYTSTRPNPTAIPVNNPLFDPIPEEEEW